jgi:hypothetical protein
MFQYIIIGIVVIGITVTIQAYGTFYLSKRIIRKIDQISHRSFNNGIVKILISTGAVLLVLHFIESFIWALTYYLLPGITEFDTLEKAIYFSLVTFTTLGYGDITISSHFRILSGLEAINGVLLLGWSTTLMLTVMQHFWKLLKKQTKKKF